MAAAADAAALPAAGNPEAEKLAGYPGFDWLRIVLASVVVLVHEGVPMPRPIDGELAVDVFFALSGWLIGGILLRTERAEMPRFFFNRATRIWLPYAAAIALLYGFAAVYQGVGAFWAKYLFFDVTFTHQLFTHFPRASLEMPLGGAGNQFWSIAVEEQFYLFAPAVMLLLPGGKRLLPWIVLAAAGFWLRQYGATIALGVIAAILRKDHGAWHLTRGGRLLVLGGTAAAFVLLIADPAVLALRGLFAVGVVLALAVPGSRDRVPVFLGGISYPLYLNHWTGAFAGHAVTRHLMAAPSDTAFVLVAYPVSIAVAIAAYLLVDRQVMMRRGGWFTPARGRALGITAYALVAAGIAGGLAIG